jgi:uncharacterized protein YndB with AHSA1/START domain
MKDNLVLKKSTTLNASPARVWDALTKPELIKEYFFGTEAVTDWKKGSPIIFRGSWEGKPYEDKGVILDIESQKFVRYTYWSSFSGSEDIPENYANISYELIPSGPATILTITQDGIKSKESLEHSASNWGMVLEGLKKLVEG